QIGTIAEVAPNYQVTTAFTSTKNASGEPELVKAFVAAYSRAIADYNAAFIDRTADQAEIDALAAIVHKYVETDSAADVAKANLIVGAQRINEGLAMAVDSLV